MVVVVVVVVMMAAEAAERNIIMMTAGPNRIYSGLALITNGILSSIGVVRIGSFGAPPMSHSISGGTTYNQYTVQDAASPLRETKVTASGPSTFYRRAARIGMFATLARVWTR